VVPVQDTHALIDLLLAGMAGLVAEETAPGTAAGAAVVADVVVDAVTDAVATDPIVLWAGAVELAFAGVGAAVAAGALSCELSLESPPHAASDSAKPRDRAMGPHAGDAPGMFRTNDKTISPHMHSID
jgi:hypothetical protein